MKITGFLWLLVGLVLWSSCRSDFETVTSTGNLQFSRDTVYLDTVFTNIGSATYTLKVYNRSNEDLTIPRVELIGGEESSYRLNVDGIPGKSFDNIDILARDSIYIFIETTLNYEQLTASENQFLHVDAIAFNSASHSQEVPLITLVKDAEFLYPRRNADGTYETIPFPGAETGEEARIKGFYLKAEELDFTAAKPYVIYGYAAVPPGQTLTIHPGARIHFHDNSGIIVPEGASMISNGTYSENRQLLEQEVIFQGDRLEPRFSDIPGQWGTIWLAAGSTSSFNYTTIKNAGIGLLVDRGHSPLSIKNSQIYNSSSTGLFARNAEIEGENLVINNSGQSSLHVAGGGIYSFKHSTFTNYWQAGFRQYPAVFISNSIDTESGIFSGDLNASLSNCIIYGNQNIELLYDEDENVQFEVRIQNSLIRFMPAGNDHANNALYDFGNSDFYEEVYLNEDPLFQVPLRNNLRLTEASPARDRGKRSTALEVPFDLLRNDRTASPDLGAYEWTAPAKDQQRN